MTHMFLSEEWMAAAHEIREKYADQVPPVTTVIRINQVIVDVPFGEGEVKAYLDTSSGRLTMELGELDEAREAATAAAAIVDTYAPLARWLAAERQLPAADVLRQLGDAEVWRVGIFNAAAALAVWDAVHREAFCAWAKAPWFC